MMNNKIKTVNPATGQVIKEYDMMTEEQILAAVKKAKETFGEWKNNKKGGQNKRADFLHNFASQLRKNKEELAKVATSEMGKAIKESCSEVEKCAMTWTIMRTMAESLSAMCWSIRMQGRVS